jgi:hypothetical protein
MQLPTNINSEIKSEASSPKEQKEWTLMFYFASDNPLAPGIVQQLKAIKNAGFHQQVNVVAQFDPQIEGIPTHVFDVNRVNKLEDLTRTHDIGFDSVNPFIRNLLLDKLWDKETNDEGITIRERLTTALKTRPRPINYHPPRPPMPFTPQSSNGTKPKTGEAPAAARGVQETVESAKNSTEEPDPEKSLRGYLEFCANEYPARHYMLFVLGHGLVVGNDMFLFDEHATKPSLRLKEVGTILQDFKKAIAAEAEKATREPGRIELISLHSCSMSSAEVIYEVQGIANYMLASQGPAFVGSYPYREILLRVFKDQVKRETGEINAPSIATTINRIFDYIYYTSYDFQMAGYPFDLSLSQPDGRIGNLTAAINELSEALIAGLQEKKSMAQQFILLAHWEAQSFWNESYTDLWDFCFCLQKRCDEFLADLKDVKAEAVVATKTGLGRISDACVVVKRALKSNGNAVIRRSNFVGPQYQYASGLSVYFPWAEPANDFWRLEYPAYTFGQQTKWVSFLQEYFDKTKRKPIYPRGKGMSLEREFLEEIQISEHKLFGIGGTLSRPDPADKPGGDAATGMAGDGAVIKNYPAYTRERRNGDTTSHPAPEVRSLAVETETA